MVSREREAPTAEPIPDRFETIGVQNEPDYYNTTRSDQEDVNVKIQTTPQTITTVGMGYSVLEPKQAISDQHLMTVEEQEAVKESFYAQTRVCQNNAKDQQNRSKPGEDIGIPLELAFRFLRDKEGHLRKKPKGGISPDRELRFMEEESAYNNKKREFDALRNRMDDSLFELHVLRKTRTSKLQTKARTSKNCEEGPVNLDQGNIFEDAVPCSALLTTRTMSYNDLGTWSTLQMESSWEIILEQQCSFKSPKLLGVSVPLY